MKKTELLRATQKQLKGKLYNQLVSYGYKPVWREGFLFAEGTVPVLLVAHLDTVHKKSPLRIWISQDGGVWKAEEGIGGDDRCGVYAVLKLIRRHHAHVLFCEDEECGGIGAEHFVKSGICPQVHFILEFDRKGTGEAVFYSCDNPAFTEFICSFGFKEAWGSFSDISILAPALGTAAVNLSCGFHDAHTKEESIVWSELEDTIAKADRLLSGELTRYDYVERKRYGLSDYGGLHWWDVAPEEYCSMQDGRWQYLMPFDGIVRDDIGNEIEVEAADQEVMIDRSGMVYEAWGDGITYLMMPELTAYDSATGMTVRYIAEQAMCCWTEEY